jgi:hypothetical protein
MKQGHFGAGRLDQQRFKRDNGARPFAARPVAFFYDFDNTSRNPRGDRLVEQAFIRVYHGGGLVDLAQPEKFVTGIDFGLGHNGNVQDSASHNRCGNHECEYAITSVQHSVLLFLRKYREMSGYRGTKIRISVPKIFESNVIDNRFGLVASWPI